METKKIKAIDKTNQTIINTVLKITESDYEDEVALELTYDDKIFEAKCDNFFYALLELRRKLELINLQIICNGSAENVYPSPMQFSMGGGRKAYINNMGQQAKTEDIVDIFDYNEGLSCVSVESQEEYHKKWLGSL